MCPYCGDPKCFQDRHHLYWPRRRYRTKLEREFRNMFVEVIWRCQHEEINQRAMKTQRFPDKPPRHVMIAMMRHRRMRLAQTG